MHNPLRLRSSRIGLGLIALVALLVSACASGSGSAIKTVTKTQGQSAGGSSSSSSSGAPSTSTTPKVPTSPVHVQAYPGDSSTVGVGMPIIATFNKKITNAVAFAKATKVTVNGKEVHGAWFFEASDPTSGHVMEAHYRLPTYWPAHSRIHLSLNTKGVSAGRGLSFDDSLTLDYGTGPRNIAVVDDATHQMKVTSDGRSFGTFPVSLGASDTPTARGIKVVMEKGANICMHGPGYRECGIKFNQRLTYGGEYMHAAPWNVRHINTGVNSSNGCTNMLPVDAERMYRLFRIGDVVEYPNADGPSMTLGAGYGDWNVDWGTWQTGGAVATNA